jgi:putative membrane protein
VTTTRLLLTAWENDPLVVAVCVVGLAIHAFALRGQPLRGQRTGWFVLAVAIFFLALVSPIGVLARGYLFCAHMLQHLLLVLVVPPLLLLGLPARAGAKLDDAEHSTSAQRGILPWAMGVGAMWLWHAPMLCDAASRSAGIQRLQTVSLLAMGTAFWWPIFAPRVSSRLAPFAAMVYLFTACIACTVLGILVTFSPVQVCSIYAHPVDSLGALPLLRDGWGLTSKADQEVGGLMMWVPACLVYAGAILAMLARYYRQEGPAPAAHAVNAVNAVNAKKNA